jgi:MFS transporter, DHA1 family, inner membrane transport protein
MGTETRQDPQYAEDHPLPSGRQAFRALVALGACAACFLTAESLPIGLLSQISASTHQSLSATGLLVTIYALVVVFATVPLAHLTRRLPRRVLLAGVAGVLVLGCAGSALAPSFEVLLAARIFTALAQSIFWAVGPVEATNLVGPELRGRAVSAVFAGSAIGIVLGLPAGTWLGHLVGWRLAFVALGVAALLLLTTILLTIPSRPPTLARSDEARGSGHQLYRVTIIVTGLGIAAFYSAYTYVSPFLVRVSGVSHGSVTLVLLGAGLASTLGLTIGGTVYTRYHRGAIAIATATMALSLLCLFVFAKQTALASLFVAGDSLGLGLLGVAGQTSVIDHGPHNGTAWFSTAYNVGIASGPLIGGLTLSTAGLRFTALAGALIAAAALTLALSANRRQARTLAQIG